MPVNRKLFNNIVSCCGIKWLKLKVLLGCIPHVQLEKPDDFKCLSVLGFKQRADSGLGKT